MTSFSEQWICRSLRTILGELPNGANIQDTKEFRDVLTALEFYLPTILAEVYADWDQESLDGIYPIVARKTGDAEADIAGMCIIISDQTVTAIQLRLQIAPADDEFSWLECELGEKSDYGIVRVPYDSMDVLSKRLHAHFFGLLGKSDVIEWVYKVTYGMRRT